MQPPDRKNLVVCKKSIKYIKTKHLIEVGLIYIDLLDINTYGKLDSILKILLAWEIFMLDELSGMIRAFLERKKWSVRHLAQVCGVSDTTICRVIGKEQVPRASTVRSILNTICDERSFRIFMIKHFPDHSNYLASRKSLFVNNPEATKFFLKNRNTFQILSLLPIRLKRSVFNKIIGIAADRLLEQALNIGIIREQNGCLTGDKVAINTEKDLLRANELAISYIQEIGLGKYYSFSFDTFAGNDKAAIRLKQAYAKLYQEIDSIRNCPECEGKIIFVTGTHFSTLKIND